MIWLNDDDEDDDGLGRKGLKFSIKMKPEYASV